MSTSDAIQGCTPRMDSGKRILIKAQCRVRNTSDHSHSCRVDSMVVKYEDMGTKQSVNPTQLVTPNKNVSATLKSSEGLDTTSRVFSGHFSVFLHYDGSIP